MIFFLVIKDERVALWLCIEFLSFRIDTLVLKSDPTLIQRLMLCAPSKIIYRTLSVISRVWTHIFVVALPIIQNVRFSANILIFPVLIATKTVSSTFLGFSWICVHQHSLNTYASPLNNGENNLRIFSGNVFCHLAHFFAKFRSFSRRDDDRDARSSLSFFS